jgi:hypothetical protein
MALTETTRACPCHAIITDPAAMVCHACGRILVPHHSAWPLSMKWWLLSELAARRFHAWLSQQDVWEWLLRDAMVGSGGITHPNPRGTQFTTSTPIADLYPPALELAQRWRNEGSPIAHSIDLARRIA